jgi:hippurate hydrolase
MTKRNSIAAMAEEMAAWRRELHENPGIAYEETYASEFVAKKLTEWGIPFKSGIAVTGIVATIEGQGEGKTIGLRGDMDALLVSEKSGQPWSSKIEGKMHACGHDGHTTIMLAAAKYFAETRNFSGKVQIIFQPAEEGARGADKMIEEGLFDDFPCDEVYGLHNWPYLPEGKAELRAGPMLASADKFTVNIKGVGGHAAYPQTTKDPIPAGAALVQAFQTIISRNVEPVQPSVLSITNFQAGTGAFNVIPDSAMISGTVRTFNEEVRQQIKSRMAEMCTAIGTAYNVEIEFEYIIGIDATVNTAKEAAFAADILRGLLGDENVNDDCDLCMGAEDFGSFLYKVPGAYIFLGQGTEDKDSPHNQTLHSPFYDFNDNILPTAVDYFAELVETINNVKKAS